MRGEQGLCELAVKLQPMRKNVDIFCKAKFDISSIPSICFVLAKLDMLALQAPQKNSTKDSRITPIVLFFPFWDVLY